MGRREKVSPMGHGTIGRRARTPTYLQTGYVLRFVPGRLGVVLAKLKWAGRKLLVPLKRSDGPNKFRLSSMDTATTTYEGDSGWAKRPPATVECDRCGSEIFHPSSREDIDCPRCVASYDPDAFGSLELLSMTCPVCKNQMVHGRRHPEQFDIPEWATCKQCRYHWEFQHSYDDKG